MRYYLLLQQLITLGAKCTTSLTVYANRSKPTPMSPSSKLYSRTSSDANESIKNKDNSLIKTRKIEEDKSVDVTYYFGKIPISSTQIFYESNYAFAMVNLRPIVPGHVLICSKRPNAQRLKDLTNEEYADLWQSVRYIQTILESYYNVSSCNIAVQDGKDAGQSVPHVHVHVLPRKNGDFERNDDVYDHLDNWHPLNLKKNTDAVQEKKKMLNLDGRKDRAMEEMSKEALTYKRIIFVDKEKQEKNSK